MPTKKLGVELNAKDKITRVVKGISSEVKQTTEAWQRFGQRGKAAIEVVAHSLQALRDGLDLVSGAIRGFWETFIAPAENARKLTASLANVFGEGTGDKIRKFSLETGLSFEAVSKAALDMEQSLGQVGGLDNYLKAIERVSNWRPDLGAEGAITYVNGLIDRLKETSSAGSKQLGQYTSVVTGGVGGQAIDLGKELDKLGVVAQTVDPAVTALDRLRAKWEEFKATVGGKIFDKLAEGAIKLLDWLTANEEKVLALTDRFVEWVNQGIQKLIEWLESGGPEQLLETFHGIADAIERIANIPIVKAMATVATKPAESFGKAADTLRMGASVGAHGLGKLFGGEKLGRKWFEAVSSIPTAAQRKQSVDVNVGVDPRNGSVQPYINRQNAEMMKGMSGGQMVPQYGR